MTRGKGTLMKSIQKAKGRVLLATMTNEPFQPVRLYYAIPDSTFVTRKLRAMECTIEVPPERCWQWLFDAEAASLRFPGGYDDVPEEKRPIVLGRIRFPKDGGMTLETNSIQRAIEGAKFFGPRLGPDVVLMRCRLVNRCFAAGEGPLPDLMKTLDRDVTVIDPRETEKALRREFAGVRPRSKKEGMQRLDECLKRMVESKDDVPMVEDFPMWPEDETPDFMVLSNTLEFRFIHAVEHWRGNTHLTLSKIIVSIVEKGFKARRGNKG